MENPYTILGTASALVAILGGVALILKNLGYTVSRPKSPDGSGNGWHRCPYYSNHIERSKTGGALVISDGAAATINELKTDIKNAHFLTAESHMQICRANLSEIKGEIRDMLDKRFEEFERRIVAIIGR